MAREYSTPGVYVEEISKFPPSIAAVETAIPAFIGYTEMVGNHANEPISGPFRITSLLEYEQYFGGAYPENSAFAITITDQTDADDRLIERDTQVTFNRSNLSRYKMYYALQQYFNNGGGPCYIVSAGIHEENGTIDNSALETALNALREIDEPTLIVFPEGTAIAEAGQYYGLINSALTQCSDLGDRFTIADVYPGNGSLRDNIQTLRNSISNDIQYTKYGAAYFPFIDTFLSYRLDEETEVEHIVNKTGEDPASGSYETLAGLKSDNPQLFKTIIRKMNSYTVQLPPSPFIAGVYARVDNDRGVWKAPANVSLNGVKKLLTPITDDDNGFMNVDTDSGKSVNAIRFFTGKGPLVWGARTLAGNDNEWRYVSVRRFFNYAEESIKKGTGRFVFEPNDANTWVKVKAMIENFLTNQWRSGALAGAKPDDAFFVKVGLGQTMSAQDILDGKLIIEIGMAVVRPAEFIILRFSHKMQQS